MVLCHIVFILLSASYLLRVFFLLAIASKNHIHSFLTTTHPFSSPSSDPILHFLLTRPCSLLTFMCTVGKLYYLPDTLIIDKLENNLGIIKKRVFSTLRSKHKSL